MEKQRVSQSEFSFELEKLSTKFNALNEPLEKVDLSTQRTKQI
jgi:hypothetical protein